ncbi:SLC13 family permease [Tepidimonas fonticaldi]|uniref:SLC13 family permease n=1 Tax=Tepidimonas fonticaldi TaxID=1101373 RepID=UPI0009EECD6D|nr:SLC13 family permease [Tepidimonas fonticaldi]
MTARAAVGLAAAAVAALAVHAGVDAPAAARGGLALFAAIGLLWLTQALHLSVTALLVPLLAVGLGLLPLREALAAFAQPVIFLFLGGFALAAALTQHGLDRALARQLLRLARGRPWPAVLGLWGTTALLSMWLSNTATTAMMLPLAIGLLQRGGWWPAVPAGPGDGAVRPPAPAAPSDMAATRTAAFVLLGVAYSASIGGMATLVGSPPNAIAAAQAGLDFAAWLAYGLPAALLLWPLMGLALALLLRPAFHRPGSPPGSAPRAADGDSTVTAPAQDADAEAPFVWTRARVLTAVIFALTALGWVVGAPLLRRLGIAGDADALVALAAIVALVGSGALRFEALERHAQWGVLLLFGGGLALGEVMARTGATAWLVQALLAHLHGWSPWLIGLALIAFVIFLTELVSNTASAALLVPIVLTLSAELGLPAAAMAASVALAASCAFMLPVATPPNAIVYGAGVVGAGAMARAGLALNVLALAVLGVLTALRAG